MDLVSYLLRQRLKRFECKIKSGFRFAQKTRYQFEPKTHLSAAYIKDSTAFKMGAFSYIRSGGEIYGDVEIGRFCSISNHVLIGLDRNAHPLHFVTTALFDPKLKALSPPNIQPTRIGHDCWIGKNALIMSGVTIGTGSVIAAGAVVTQDVSPYTIVANVPAREVRPRFEPALQAALLASQWWNSDPEYLLTLPMNDPVQFLSTFKPDHAPHSYQRSIIEERQFRLQTPTSPGDEWSN